jgi:hypothetical protein
MAGGSAMDTDLAEIGRQAALRLLDAIGGNPDQACAPSPAASSSANRAEPPHAG